MNTNFERGFVERLQARGIDNETIIKLAQQAQAPKPVDIPKPGTKLDKNFFSRLFTNPDQAGQTTTNAPRTVMGIQARGEVPTY